MALTSRLSTLPAGFFGIVLGLGGLAGAWRGAKELWGLSPVPGEAIALCAVAVWAVLCVLYALKWVLARAHAIAEFQHPIQCCFIGIVPVSTALVALLLRPYNLTLATALAVVGVAAQLVFGVFRTGELWKGNRDPQTTTPVLYLPTVAGSFVSAIVLSAFGAPSWAVPFFGAGLFSWLAIESVLIHRLYVVSELAEPLRPTLGIQLAPPAVGSLAWLSINPGPPDLLVQAMLGYALFQALILLRLLPWIHRQPFAASYWAFSFGVSALAAATVQFVKHGGTGPLAVLAPWIFAAASLVIVGLLLGTLWLLVRGRLLPPAAPATPTAPALAPAR